MDVIPAIDLRGGRCVRLTQGDYARETAYDDDPVAVARRFAGAGARRLHVVDLDGARAGKPEHLAVLFRIARESRLAVEFGGGVRALEDVTAAFEAGAGRVILGTAAFRDPEMLHRALDRHPGRIIVSVDVRGAEVMGAGWREAVATGEADALARLKGLGVKRVVYTDTTRDGTLEGVDPAAVRAVLARAAGMSVQWAGGIRDVTDIRLLAPLSRDGLEAVIAGKALYEGTLDLVEALEAVKKSP